MPGGDVVIDWDAAPIVPLNLDQIKQKVSDDFDIPRRLVDTDGGWRERWLAALGPDELGHHEIPGREAQSPGFSGELRQFGSGAVRDADADETRYDLIPPAALEAMARTYGFGARKYTDNNYLRGMPFSSVLNHLLRHIDLWRVGDRSEDHLAHACWGLFTLIEFTAEGREEELNDMWPFPPLST